MTDDLIKRGNCRHGDRLTQRGDPQGGEGVRREWCIHEPSAGNCWGAPGAPRGYSPRESSTLSTPTFKLPVPRTLTQYISVFQARQCLARCDNSPRNGCRSMLSTWFMTVAVGLSCLAEVVSVRILGDFHARETGGNGEAFRLYLRQPCVCRSWKESTTESKELTAGERVSHARHSDKTRPAQDCSELRRPPRQHRGKGRRPPFPWLTGGTRHVRLLPHKA